MKSCISSLELISFRNFKNFVINLPKENGHHLILTGKNGSGKTSLLRNIALQLDVDTGIYESKSNIKRRIESYKRDPEGSDDPPGQILRDYRRLLRDSKGISIEFEYSTYSSLDQKKSFFVFFESKRTIQFDKPSGIKNLDLTENKSMHERINAVFIQYLVNSMADRAFAKEAQDLLTVNKIDSWFQRLETALSFILDVPDLKLKFDRKNYDFTIILADREIDFNQLSDGFSAILGIISELIMRMEGYNVQSYDLKGIVIIDEIETHLHVDLQRKILPFLIDFFPGLQFIVTTHSPFVLTSVQNATVVDLEKKIITTDLSSYSYNAIIESYFDSDKYSEISKTKLDEFEYLTLKNNLDDAELVKLTNLREYFSNVPKYFSSELVAKLQEIKIKELTTHKKSNL